MSEEKRVDGPFGSYKRESCGHVLNALCEFGIPINAIERWVFTKDNRMSERTTDGWKEQVRYKYFDGIEQPLFLFQNQVLNQQRWERGEDGVLRPKFRLSLNASGTPGLSIGGPMATPELHAFMHRMLTNWVQDPCYAIHQAAGAFFQGGADNPNGEYIFIEFWKTAGAQAFIDYVNEHYIHKEEEVYGLQERKTQTPD
jgi:hypothetical protein